MKNSKGMKLAKKSGIILLSGALITQAPFSTQFVMAAENNVYQPKSSNDLKLQATDFEHAYFMGQDTKIDVRDDKGNNKLRSEARVKVIPLTDENDNHEQEWMIIYNMGLHDELYNSLPENERANVDLNDEFSRQQYLNRQDVLLNYTSKPNLSFTLSKDLKVDGNIDVYAVGTTDNGKYISSFDDIKNRVLANDPNDGLILAHAQQNPTAANATLIPKSDKFNETVGQFDYQDKSKADTWDKFKEFYMAADAGGKNAFEFRSMKYSTNPTIQMMYNPQYEDPYAGWSRDFRWSVGNIILNDANYGARFEYSEDDKPTRFVLKFKTKRTPLDFFEDKFDFVMYSDKNGTDKNGERYDSNSKPMTTFVAGTYKSHDDSKVYHETDFTFPTMAFADSDSDGLSDYYEKLIGSDPNAEDTDKDGKNDWDEYLRKNRINSVKNAKSNADGTNYDTSSTDGRYKIPASDPAVGQINIEHKVTKVKGDIVRGKAVPYATVAMYAFDEAGRQGQTPLAETVADENGDYKLVVGKVLNRTKDLNVYRNDIEYQDEEKRIPTYSEFDQAKLDELAPAGSKVKVNIWSDGNDYRPSFLIPYVTDEQPIVEPAEKVKEILEEKDLDMDEAINPNDPEDVKKIIDKIKEDEDLAPFIDPNAKEGENAYILGDNLVINTPSGERLEIPLEDLGVSTRELGNITVTQPKEEETSIDINLPDGVQTGDKISIKVGENEVVNRELTPDEIAKKKVTQTVDPLVKDSTIEVKLTDDKSATLKTATTTVAEKDKTTNNNPVKEKPVVDKINEDNPSIKIGNIDPNADKITVKVGDGETIELTKGDNGWTLPEDKKTNYDLTEEGDGDSKKLVVTPKDDTTKNKLEGKDIVVDVTNTGDDTNTTLSSDPVRFDTTKPSAPTITEAEKDGQVVKVKIPNDSVAGDKVIVKVGEGDNQVTKEYKITDKDVKGDKNVEVNLDTPLAVNDIVTVVVEDEAGNTSDKVTKTITDSETPAPTKPAKPEVDPINKDDNIVKVKVPAGENDNKVVVELPGGSKVEVTKGEDGTWKTGDGTEVLVKEGKLEIPVDNTTIKNGGDVKVTVEDKDGTKSDETTITVNTDGSEEKDSDKNDPKAPKTKVEVENPSALTDDEKSKVKEEVEKANKDENGKSKLPDGTTITVGDDGTVTITYPDKSTDKIPGKDVVTGKENDNPYKITEGDSEITIKDPDDADKIVIKIPTEPEKVITLEKDGEGNWTSGDGVTVEKTPEGNLIVKLPEGVVIPAPTEGKDKVEITVEKDGEVKEKKEEPINKRTETEKDSDKNDPTVPKTKVEVENPSALTDDEKNKVKEEVEKANKDESGKSKLPDGTTITVGDDGTVTITYPDKSTDKIPGSEVVTGKETPTPTKPAKPEVDPINKDDNTVKVKVPAGENDNKVVVELPGGSKVEVTKGEDGTWNTGDGTEVPVKDGKLEIPVDNTTIQNGGDVKVTVEDKDGRKSDETTVTVNTDGSDEKDADKYTPTVPKTKVEVENPSALTDDEKNKVKEEVEKANKDENGKSKLPDGTTITVGDDGTVTITYPDKSTDTIPGKDVVTKKGTADPTDTSKDDLKKVIDEAEKTKGDDKYKNSDKEKKDEFDKALDEAKKVLEDKDSTKEDREKAKKKLEDAIKNLNGKSDNNNNSGNTNNGTSDSTNVADENSSSNSANTLPKTGVGAGIPVVSAIIGAIGAFITRRRKDEE